MLRICIINPPNDGNMKMEGYEWMPNIYTTSHLGVGYIASFMEEKGYDVDLIDCPSEEVQLKELFSIIEEKQYDIIGLSTYYFNVVNVSKIIAKTKRIKSNTHFILGGYLATLAYEMLLKSSDSITACVLGEGELTFYETVQAIEQGLDLSNVDGLAFKKNDEIITTKKREAIKDLNILPVPKRIKSHGKGIFTNLISSRGCFGKCSFCGISQFYTTNNTSGIRKRSPEQVVEEIQQIVLDQNPTFMIFHDETFFNGSKNDKKWVKEFHRLIVEKNLISRFDGMARVRDVLNNEESLLLLKEVGFTQYFIGIESFVQRQLDFFNKKITVEENINALKLLRELDIKTHIGLILLDPYSTIEEIHTNIKVLKDLEYHEMASIEQSPLSFMNPLIAVAGTDIYKHLIEKDMYVSNERGYDFIHKEVEIFKEGIDIWVSQIYNIVTKQYLYFKAINLNAENFIEENSEHYNKLIKVDLDFMSSLCEMIEEGNYSLEKVRVLAEDYFILLKPLQTLIGELEIKLEEVEKAAEIK